MYSGIKKSVKTKYEKQIHTDKSVNFKFLTLERNHWRNTQAK
jgi:hypothetical protein